MNKRLTLVGAFAALCFTAGSVRANDCRDSTEDVQRLITVINSVCASAKKGGKTCDLNRFSAVIPQTKSWESIWSDTFGSRGMLAPRSLAYNSPDSGKLVNPGVRTWITLAPSVGALKVEIKASSGNAGLDVSYCTLKPNGTIEFLGKDSSSGGSSPPVKQFTDAQVGGRFLIIKMEGSGGAMKKYEYGITLSGKMLE